MRYGILGLLASLAVVGYAAAYTSHLSGGPVVNGSDVVRAAAQRVQKVRNERHRSSSPRYAGGCTAYLPAIESEPNVPREEIRGEAKHILDNFFAGDIKNSGAHIPPRTVTFAIALAPDPVHTNLGLFFDREIVSIQQAAQDAGYDFDSAWLPWQRGVAPVFNNLADRQQALLLEHERESCPGVLLFRKHMVKVPIGAKPQTQDAYANALVVFVVGEQPTGGISQQQWSNAVSWMASLDGRHPYDDVLRVLGPTFSGSFPSLTRSLLSTGSFSKVLVLSGSATSSSAIEIFQGALNGLQTRRRLNGDPESRFSFGTFNENDELHISRFLGYLKQQGTKPDEVAVLSEDETAYATLGISYVAPGEKPPLELKYPRDISVIRDAYQKQSVFESAIPRAGVVRSILRSQGESAGEENLDSLPAFSGDISALDQEARLFGLLDHLRAHHIHYLILRSTNPLDLLFLSRFFHRVYSEARIVTVGSDLLFRREIETTEFRGMIALSSYSLLAREPDWPAEKALHQNNDSSTKDIYVHQIFTGNMSQGAYMAARYLFENEIVHQWSEEDVREQTLPMTFRPVSNLPAYGNPHWLAPIDPAESTHRPPTWISTLGRDGYWPIAAVNSSTIGSRGCYEV